MTTDLLRRKARLAAALAALAAALVTAALMASAGSAQAPAAATTLHLTSTPQKGVGFGSFAHRPHQGDRFGFGGVITGDDTGYDRELCTTIGRGLVCTIQVQLSKGALTVQGIVPQTAKNTPLAITGGTGAYDGARGTALATDRQGHTDIVVNLLP
jgi:hypothetical protein